MVNSEVNKDNRKKIAWIVGKNYHSSLSRIYKESQSLSKNGYQVKIYSLLTDYKYPKYENNNNVEIIRIPIPLIKYIFPVGKVNKIIILLWTIKILRVLKKFSPDIVYCSNLYTTHIGYFVKKLYKTSFIYDSHDLFIDQQTRYKDLKIVRFQKMRYEKFISKNASVVIQTTQSRADKFEEYYGIKPKIIKNKPIGNEAYLNLPEELKSIIGSGKKIIGYLGSIHTNRGLEQLIETTRDFDNTVIVIMGYARSSWAKDFIKNNKKKVLWIPAVIPNKITSIAKHFTLGITLIQNTGLSYYYSCPTKVFEFVVSGVPQISSNFPEISDLIINNPIGPLGRVVDPSNINEIKTAISDLLNSPEDLETYRKNCNTIKHQCTWESQEKKFVKLINSIY